MDQSGMTNVLKCFDIEYDKTMTLLPDGRGQMWQFSNLHNDAYTGIKRKTHPCEMRYDPYTKLEILKHGQVSQVH